MWRRDTKRANAVGKMASIDLLGAGWPPTFSLWKTQCLRSTVNPGVPCPVTDVILRRRQCRYRQQDLKPREMAESRAILFPVGAVVLPPGARWGESKLSERVRRGWRTWRRCPVSSAQAQKMLQCFQRSRDRCGGRFGCRNSPAQHLSDSRQLFLSRLYHVKAWLAAALLGSAGLDQLDSRNEASPSLSRSGQLP